MVVRSAPDGAQLRTAVVEREIAQAMALKEWISCPDASGRVARYFITNAGRGRYAGWPHKARMRRSDLATPMQK